jgi:hypothetical protein
LETEEEGLRRGEETLQEWQEQILNMSMEEERDEYMWIEEPQPSEDEIPITQSQMRMLEKVLGDDFYIGDERIRDTLNSVLELGFYFERDKEVLNLARKCYLEGRNWIKKKHG